MVIRTNDTMILPGTVFEYHLYKPTNCSSPVPPKNHAMTAHRRRRWWCYHHILFMIFGINDLASSSKLVYDTQQQRQPPFRRIRHQDRIHHLLIVISTSIHTIGWWRFHHQFIVTVPPTTDRLIGINYSSLHLLLRLQLVLHLHKTPHLSILPYSIRDQD